MHWPMSVCRPGFMQSEIEKNMSTAAIATRGESMPIIKFTWTYRMKCSTASTRWAVCVIDGLMGWLTLFMISLNIIVLSLSVRIQHSTNLTNYCTSPSSSSSPASSSSFLFVQHKSCQTSNFDATHKRARAHNNMNDKTSDKSEVDVHVHRTRNWMTVNERVSAQSVQVHSRRFQSNARARCNYEIHLNLTAIWVHFLFCFLRRSPSSIVWLLHSTHTPEYRQCDGVIPQSCSCKQ